MSSNFVGEISDFGSTFGDDDNRHNEERLVRRERLVGQVSKAKASTSVFSEEAARDEGRRIRMQFLSMNAYDRHKMLVNEYLLCYAGATDNVLKRDTSKDKTDMDVIKQHHKFLWDENEKNLTWEHKLAKKYYEKLFKEYCICDLSRFKENKVAMRWRTEEEVKLGKGQFMCGSRKCSEAEMMRTWEVNFAYIEAGEKKNALVKIRLCPDCSYKLNYHHKRKDVSKTTTKKRKEKTKKRKSRRDSETSGEDEISKRQKMEEENKEEDKKATEIWSAPLQLEQEKSREDDFSEYLEDLFL